MGTPHLFQSIAAVAIGDVSILESAAVTWAPPPARQASGPQDLLRSRLDQIVDRAQPLAKLAHDID